MTAAADRPSPARAPRAAVYLAGAAAAAAASAAGELPLQRVPLAVGVVLLVCAAACPRGDGPWGAGLLLLAVGAGALAAERDWLPTDASLVTGGAAGGLVGLAVVVVLHDRGIAAEPLATAVAAVLAGVVLAARDDVGPLARPGLWVLWLLLLGAVNLLLWARDRELATSGPGGAASR